MGDPRNKIRKALEREADKRAMTALAGYYGPPKPPANKPPTMRCDGCGMDGADHWKSGGEFIRLFSLSGHSRWDDTRIFCEHCLERETGMKPNELT